MRGACLKKARRLFSFTAIRDRPSADLVSAVKITFAVSAMTEIWPPDTKSVFAIDKFIPHIIERNKRGSAYEFSSAPPARAMREDFESEHDYVDEKFRYHTEILIDRLEDLHGRKLGGEFWRKALALGLMRHITFCHDLFRPCESHLDPAVHACRILDPSSFRIPKDFDEQRQIFQHTDLGQEQLFSTYCSLFHPGSFHVWKPQDAQARHDAPQRAPATVASSRLARMVRLLRSPGDLVKRVLRSLLNWRSPRMAIIECSFASEHADRLVFGSRGLIQQHELPPTVPPHGAPDWSRRERLSRDEAGFDRFDRFVFASLKYAFPRQLLEEFSASFETLAVYFSQWPTLRWIVCEWWIGRSWSSLAMAVAKTMGIRHICNEHNYLARIFVGNNLKYQVRLVDEFLTLGWFDGSLPNITRGASLYRWSEPNTDTEKKHDILLICGLPLARVPEVTTGYGDSGAYRALSYFGFTKKFMAALESETLKTVYVRSYPRALTQQWLCWDQADAFAPEIARAKHYDDSGDDIHKLMGEARLIVVNYLSTSYLEAIIADIPTVVLWNRDTNLFSRQYQDAFDALIESGICHTDPESAARFVNTMKDDPERWWRSPKVRRARQQFLDANIGNPDVMLDYLFNKVRNAGEANVVSRH